MCCIGDIGNGRYRASPSKLATLCNPCDPLATTHKTWTKLLIKVSFGFPHILRKYFGWEASSIWRRQFKPFAVGVASIMTNCSYMPNIVQCEHHFFVSLCDFSECAKRDKALIGVVKVKEVRLSTKRIAECIKAKKKELIKQRGDAL